MFDRPSLGSLATIFGGNDESGDTSGVPAGSAGSSNLVPGGSVPVHDVIVRRDDALSTQAAVISQSGDCVAWIGGISNGDFRMYHSTLQQDVAVPA